MKKIYINILGVLMILIALVFVSISVDAAKRFDVTDISYSNVSYNYPYYPNVPYYNSYYDYGYYYPSGYVSPYTGYITPTYTSYVNSYYSTYTYPSYSYSTYTYPTYYNYNTISYVNPNTRVSFSWQ